MFDTTLTLKEQKLLALATTRGKYIRAHDKYLPGKQVVVHLAALFTLGTIFVYPVMRKVGQGRGADYI